MHETHSLIVAHLFNTDRQLFLKRNLQEADVAAGPLTVTEERSAVVAFTDPFLEFRYTAIIKKPRKRKMRIKTAEQLLDSDLPYGVEVGSISQVDVYSLIYRSGTLNSNTVNSKFHLIRSFFEIFARFLSFHV